VSDGANVKVKRFSIGAWLALVAAAILLLGSIVQIAYRYTLPTDGWSVMTDDAVEANWIYYRNLVGAPSDLQTDDVLLAVDGLSLLDTATSEPLPAPPSWQTSQTVTFLVRRGEQQLELVVPIVHWTLAAVARYNLLDPIQFASLAGSLLLLVVGWFTFLRRPEVPSARALLLLSTAVAATYISTALPDGLSVQFDPVTFWATLFYSYAIFGVVIAPALLTFALLFPNPKRIIQRHPWLALLPLAYGGLLFLFLAAGGPGIAGWISTLAMFVLAIMSFIHAGFNQRDPTSRAQLRWALTGFVIGLSLFLLNFPLSFNWITNPTLMILAAVAQSLAMLVIGLGLAVAVLRYRLWDIDVIIRKTLIYTVITVLLAMVYFGVVILLQSIFEAVSRQQSPVIIVISTLIIAALFAPLRRRVQDFIDRRFYRRRYDAEKTLAAFADFVRDQTDMAALTAELLRVTEETMQPEQVSVWLNTSGTEQALWNSERS